MGQLFATLPPHQRLSRYRQFAAQAMIKAQEATNPDQLIEYLNIAAGWHALAVEAERSFNRAIPGKTISPANDEVAPDNSPEGFWSPSG